MIKASRIITRSADPFAFGRPDGDVFEDASLPEDADDHHHPKQEDYVPVDAVFAG